MKFLLLTLTAMLLRFTRAEADAVAAPAPLPVPNPLALQNRAEAGQCIAYCPGSAVSPPLVRSLYIYIYIYMYPLFEGRTLKHTPTDR